jgi:hypothetical protein
MCLFVIDVQRTVKVPQVGENILKFYIVSHLRQTVKRRTSL